MIKQLLTDLGNAVLVSMVLVSGLGAALSACDQGQPAQKPATGVHTGRQAPHYTGAPECLTEGVALAAECNERGELPGCLAEDGSGPGVYCFWTDPDTGRIWFNDGNEHNDPQDMP